MPYNYSSKVLWTALPNGFDPDVPGYLRVSLLASPQLTSDDPNPTLDKFPDIHSWPVTVSGFDFALDISGNPVTAEWVLKELPGRPKPEISLRPDFWAALFGIATNPARRVAQLAPLADSEKPPIPSVKPYRAAAKFNYSHAEINTYAVAPISQHIREAYSSALQYSNVRSHSTDQRFSATSSLRELYDQTDLYLRANASPQDRLKTEKALESLESFVTYKIPEGSRGRAKMLKDQYIRSLSSSKGLDLKPQTIDNIQEAIVRRMGLPPLTRMTMSSRSLFATSIADFASFHRLRDVPRRPMSRPANSALARLASNGASSTIPNDVPSFDFHQMVTFL